MKHYLRQTYVLLVLLAIGVPCAALAEDTRSGSAPTRAPTPATPARDVAAPEEDPEAIGLLLPAVQKARDAAGSTSSGARDVGMAPQKGIEPDEIDARSRAASPPRAQPARELDKATPARGGAVPGGRSLSTRQMMLKLKPRQPTLVAVGTGGGASAATNVQTKPPEPPKYEIAECGTAASPMICCHHEPGDGSSCNLFKILCENAGGTAQGDGESAACSDW